MKAVLVYQAGIANVFEVDCFNMASFGRNAKRICQGSFSQCENFAWGLAHAGWKIASAYCNNAGDIVNQEWKENLNDAPFCDKFHPVWCGVSSDIYFECQ
jgi:hypothetical protein